MRIPSGLLAMFASVAVATPVPSADAHSGCKSHACITRVFKRQCSNVRPRACVEYAIQRHRFTGWQAAWMRRIPHCESGYSWNAYYPSKHATSLGERKAVVASDTSGGLYAFKPSTFKGTPFAGIHWRTKFWSPYWQSLAAGWMVTQNRVSEWSCQ